MQYFLQRLSRSACVLAASALVAACGGGGASAPGSTPSSFGWAVDGYLSGATIVCDSNGNGVQDAGETTTTTASDGLFRFNTACTSALIAFGGTNTDSGQPFTGMLKAPAGALVVTPLTSLLAGGMTEAQVRALLGIPDRVDIKMIDPALKIDGALVEPDFFKKSLAIQQIIQKMSETIAALTGDTSAAAIRATYDRVAQSLATAGKTGGLSTLISGTTVNLAAMTTLITAASQPGVAGMVNPDSLGMVIAGGIKAQVEAILGAAPAGIAAAATTQQADQQIKNFVLANSAQIGAAPTGATATLGTTLTNQLAGGGGGGAGTLLVSFDEANPVFSGMGAYGGAEPTVVAGPSGGSGNALKIVKPAGQQVWGGVFFNVPAIPFASDRKKLSARVNSTRAGAVIKFKVEIAGGGSVEIVGSPTGAANTWSTVTWDFGAANVADAYTVIAITPDAELATAGHTYYIDEITLAAAVVVPPPVPGAAFISFDEAMPAFTGMGAFGGAAPTVEPGPAGGNGNALKVVKPAGQEPWGGVFFGTAPIPFTNSNKTITARVNSTRAGAIIRFKVEVSGGSSVEVDGTPAGAANTWSTVTWDFSGVNLANTYSVMAITPDFGLAPTGQSYFIDEIKVVASVVVPPPAPGAAFISFDEAMPAFTGMGAFGGAAPTVEPGPVDGSGNALKVVKAAGQEPWGGVFFGTAPIPFTNSNKTITARVNSSRAGAVIRFKVEVPGGSSVEVDGTPAGVANTWSTVTWDFSGVNLANTYSVMAITPDFGLAPAGHSYYIDEIKVVASGGGGGGGAPDPNAEMGSGGPQTLSIAATEIKTGDGGLSLFVAGEGIFANDYKGGLEAGGNFAAFAGATTIGNGGLGNIGHFQDDVGLSNSPQKTEEGGWVSGTILAPLGAPNFFRYFIMKAPAIPNSYLGLYVNAPNNGTVDVSAFSRIKLGLWGPNDMYNKAGFTPQGLEVVLAGAKVAGCGTGSGGTEIRQTFDANVKIGAASVYKLQLSGFTVKGKCGADANLNDAAAIASVLSKLARVVVTVPGTAFNFTIPTDNALPSNYAIGLNLGRIGFTNVP